jgi:hypothetical protein
MNLVEYPNTERDEEWPAGPWDDEPGKRVWIDDDTGLDCLMVRNRYGVWCGYVGVPPEHPYHGRDYDDMNVDVHGGLTFAAGCQEGLPPEIGICHTPVAGRPDNVWWLGFDTGHFMDYQPRMAALEKEIPEFPDIMRDCTYRDVAYVETEVANLARQLALRDVP